MATRSATRTAILDAARDEFATMGFRRASVEGVSRRAGLARATVYLHWSGKDELFVALVDALHAEHLAAMRRVLDDPPTDLVDRLVAVLEARFGLFVQLTSASPYGAELYDVHDRLCGDVAARANAEADRLTARLLRRSRDAGELDLARSGLTVPRLVRVLTDCAHGAKGDPGAGEQALVGPRAYRDRLTAVVRALVHGVGT